MTDSLEAGEILRRLDDLIDLFRRRLQDDRDKRRLIDELAERLGNAETGPFRQYLHPVVNALALILDRLDQYVGSDPEFAVSIRAELSELLASHGVTEIRALGPFDPAIHEAIASRSDEEHPAGTVIEIYSCGLVHGQWVFRPARVVVSSEPIRHAIEEK